MFAHLIFTRTREPQWSLSTLRIKLKPWNSQLDSMLQDRDEDEKRVPCSSCSNKITTSNSYLHYNPKQFPPKRGLSMYVWHAVADFLANSLAQQTLRLGRRAGTQAKPPDWLSKIQSDWTLHIIPYPLCCSFMVTSIHVFKWIFLESSWCWDPLGLMLRRSLWEQECLEKCWSIPQDAQGGCQGTHRGFHGWFGYVVKQKPCSI